MALKNIDLKDKFTVYALIIVLLVLGGAYYFYENVWVPYEGERQRLDAEIDKLQVEVDKINVRKKMRVQLMADLESARKELDRLQKMFPEQEKVPLRLQDLYGVIRSSGVQITKFAPEAAAQKEYFIENRYSVALNSGYHMLGYLFAEIANFAYPTAISELQVNRFAGIKQEMEKASLHGWTPVTTSVTFNLTTFTSRAAQ